MRLAMDHLANGRQKEAESLLETAAARTEASTEVIFLRSVCKRSRFQTQESTLGWAKTINRATNTPIGQAAACILGQDQAKNTSTALYYFSGLMEVARRNPDNIVIHWMAGVMARALTRDETQTLAEGTRQRIIAYGIAEYRTALTQFSPGIGPTLIHQVVGNMLNQLADYPGALEHYGIVLNQERRSWSLNPPAEALRDLGRWEESLVLIRESLQIQPKDNTWAHAVGGQVLWGLGRYEEAIAELKLAQPGENAAWSLFYGQRLMSAGYPVQAWGFLQYAHKNNPQDKVSVVLLARLAALAGQTGATDALLQAGSLNWKGEAITLTAETHPFLRAVQTGDLATVRLLLPNTPPDSVTTTEDGATALMISSQIGWPEITQALLDAGANPDLVDKNRDTALHYACQFKQSTSARLLVAAGANLNPVDKWNQTPLIMAADSGQWDIVRVFIDCPRLDLSLSPPKRGTPLQYVAGHGMDDIVRKLIARHASIDAVNVEGYTALMVTCQQWPHPETLTTLLDAGAAIDARDLQGRTALRLAIQPTPRPQLTDLLLKRGANPALADQQGVTPIAAAHLLGYGELAARMETLSGTSAPLPWNLPLLAKPADPTSAEALRDAFTLPIALIQGLSLENSAAKNRNTKKMAREELKRQFGITDLETFKTTFRAIDQFLPIQRPAQLATALDQDHPAFAAWIDSIVVNLYSRGTPSHTNPLAWRKSQLIYLARLGGTAEFLPADEAEAICASASDSLRGTFTSWKEFTESFLFGARQNAGWELARYEHICQLLLARPETTSPWNNSLWAPTPLAQPPATGTSDNGLAEIISPTTPLATTR